MINQNFSFTKLKSIRVTLIVLSVLMLTRVIETSAILEQMSINGFQLKTGAEFLRELIFENLIESACFVILFRFE